jgi:curved DNA-binding protein
MRANLGTLKAITAAAHKLAWFYFYLLSLREADDKSIFFNTSCPTFPGKVAASQAGSQTLVDPNEDTRLCRKTIEHASPRSSYHQRTRCMADNGFTDYYELLQINPNAELETINRVYKMLATRHHPDNVETGDLDKFLTLKQAYETLSNPSLRAEYDARYEQRNTGPIEIFELKEFSIGVEGEANRRMGILCLLYTRRRSNPDDPGLSLLEFESMMSVPREHLLFTMWYLKEHNCVRQDDASDYVITGEGVDYVETHLPSNKLLYRLLKAAENGVARTATREPQEE